MKFSTEIFSEFDRAVVRGTGEHVFDFTGARFHRRVRAGFERNLLKAGVETTPGYPSPNEHYYDWLVMLTAIHHAPGTFRMAELGAGFGLWTVRAWWAARQRLSAERIQLLGIEADETHFEWFEDTLEDNTIPKHVVTAIKGAAVDAPRLLKFPVSDEPHSNYGTSIYAKTENYCEVQGYSVEQLFERFAGPVDFLHVDIQGAEYEALPVALDLLSRQCRFILIGTHRSDDRHNALHQSFADAGWITLFNVPRKSTVDVGFGLIETYDGALAYRNPALT